MRKNYRKRIYTTLAVLIIIIITASIVYWGIEKLMGIRYHKAILELTTEVLTFETDAMDEELEILNDWLNRPFVTDADRGLLYERVSYLYQNKGDTIAYYNALACAMYYLELGDVKDTNMNVHADLAHFFDMNGAEERAREILDQAYTIEAIDEIESNQVRSYFYRMEGILCLEEGKYDLAESNFAMAQEIISASMDQGWAYAYQAILDAQKVRLLYHQGHYQEAKELIDAYEGTEFYHPTMYTESMASGFILPMSEIETYIEIETGNFEMAKINLASHVGYCQIYNFPRYELNTILYIMNNLVEEGHPLYTFSSDLIYKLYSEIADYQSQEYTALIASQLAESREEAIAKRESHIVRHRNTIEFACVFVLLVAVAGFFNLAIYNGRKDGLTGVNNRRCLNTDVFKLNKQGKRYAAIMMDIDDFKMVNDTFGHLAGDQVLMRVGEILTTMSNTEFHAYRYGGEEFVCIASEHCLDTLEFLVEGIRSTVESQTWDFPGKVTLSVGVALSDTSTDAIKAADAKMYEAKHLGKNRVCM